MSLGGYLTMTPTEHLRDRPIWATRDLKDGVLSSLVEIWTERPTIERSGADITWVGPGVTGMESKLGQMTVDECRKEFGTVPDSERECVTRA